MGVGCEGVCGVVKRTCEEGSKGGRRETNGGLCGCWTRPPSSSLLSLCHSSKLKTHYPLTHHTLSHPLHSARTIPVAFCCRPDQLLSTPGKPRSSTLKRTMAPPSSRRLFLGLLLLSLFQGLQSLKDYHNIFCGKENCYDVLGVPQVSSSPSV